MAAILTSILSRNQGTMSYTYFMICWKGPGSLELNRTKFGSELWYLAIWLSKLLHLPYCNQGNQPPCCVVKGGHECKGLHLVPFTWKFTHSRLIYYSLVGMTRHTVKYWTGRQGIINGKLFDVYNTFSLLYYQFVFMFGGYLNQCV